MGLIARVTGTGKASNCMRRSRVLFALPVPVTSAINPIFARATMLLIANHVIIPYGRKIWRGI